MGGRGGGGGRGTPSFSATMQISSSSLAPIPSVADVTRDDMDVEAIVGAKDVAAVDVGPLEKDGCLDPAEPVLTFGGGGGGGAAPPTTIVAFDGGSSMVTTVGCLSDTAVAAVDIGGGPGTGGLGTAVPTAAFTIVVDADTIVVADVAEDAARCGDAAAD